jgi:hypothetical protein
VVLGRDELLKAGPECDRKILVLTDGHLNQGITEPDRVEALTRSGFGKDGIRTGCLGFGNSYNEQVLAAMSAVGHGQLHDADSAEKFPAILLMNWTGSRKSPCKTSVSESSPSFSAIPGRNTAIIRLSRFWMAG